MAASVSLDAWRDVVGTGSGTRDLVTWRHKLDATSE
jgi:hypothetical protein